MATGFISYSRKDKTIAVQLCEDLEVRGLSCWMDLQDIPGGSVWAKEIKNALAECRYLFLLLSPNSMLSEAVRFEYSYAIKKMKVLFPILLGECTIPDEIAHIQYIDFRDYNQGFTKLLQVIPKDAFTEEMSLDALVNKLKSNDAERRRDALLSIGDGKMYEALDYILDAFNDKDGDMRAAAAWILDSWIQDTFYNPDAIPRLINAIHDEFFDVRSNAGWALVHLGLAAIGPVKKVLMESSNPEARQMAQMILERISLPEAAEALKEYAQLKPR